ncbi:Eukaryotic protein of unknown function (DUF829) domain containing protein [Amanita muscaria]
MADHKVAREAGFDVLGTGIYMKRPLPDSDVIEDETHPTVLLFFAWMGAKLPHIFKYTNRYEKLYPSATQLLIRCEVINFGTPQWFHSSSLRPAIEALEALGCITSQNGTDKSLEKEKPKHRILVHAFSNGGCLQLQTLSGKLMQYLGTNVTASAIIFDSCPGSGSLSSSINAVSSAINFMPLRILLIVCMYPFYFYLNVLRLVFGIPPILELIRTHTNRPHFLPWLTTSSPRLYIYSTKDDVIPWQEVESHAEDAERVYAVVKKEKFESSMHVAHMKHDPDRYWGAIKDLWNAACKLD